MGIGKIKNIIEGHVNELKSKLGQADKDLEKIASIRKNICEVCPLNKNGVCDSDLYLDPKTLNVTSKPKQGYYQGCGCRLEAKRRVLSEKCPAGLWGGEQKTDSHLGKIPIISLSGTTIDFSFDKNSKIYLANYGEIEKSTNTEIKFNLDINHNNIIKLESSCGCTTPRISVENGNTMLIVKYDNSVLGSFRKNVTITEKSNNKTIIQLIGNVRR